MIASSKFSPSNLILTSLSIAIGLVAIGWGYREGWANEPSADWWFWLGLALVVGPVALKLVQPNLTSGGRIKLLILLGLSLYAVKVLRNPVEFNLTDEFLHWRATSDILQTSHLFKPNPLLPIGTYYPGLHIITAAFAGISQLSIYEAGTAIIGLAHLLAILGLFLFYREAGFSEQVAGIATLIYAANPNFIFFDSMFAYESLALPLVIFCLYLAAKLHQGYKGWGFKVIVVLALSMTSITHHLSSYFLVAVLVVWWLVGLVRRSSTVKIPTWTVGLALGLVVAWTVEVAHSLSVSYLLPAVNSGVKELLQIVFDNSSGRTLFQSSSGQSAPLNEQLSAFGSVGLILLGLPLGWWQLARRYRSNALIITLGLLAGLYPVSLGLRLTHFGAEVSNRSAEFIFIGVAAMLALALVKWLPGFITASGAVTSKWQPLGQLGRRVAWVSAVLVLFSGGLAIGIAHWARMPGPYQAASDSRSIERESIAASQWARDNIGADQRVVTDRVNRLLLGSYGEQRPVTNYGDNLNLTPIFFSPAFGPTEQALIEAGQIHYIVVDQRLSANLPLSGVYVEQGEPDTNQHKTAISQAALSKFDAVDALSRQFDSGDIQVFRWTVDIASTKSLPLLGVGTNLFLADTASGAPQVSPFLPGTGQPTPGWNWLLALMVGVLMLVCPGYWLSRWLLGSAYAGFDPTERFVVASVSSFGLLGIGGILLNLTEWGVVPLSWLVTLAALVTGGMSLLKAGRSGKIILQGKKLIAGISPLLRPVPIITTLVGVVLISLAFGVVASQARQARTASFSQLWLNPTQEEGEVKLGLANQETQTTQYKLVVESNGKVLKTWPKITLGKGYQWNIRLQVPTGEPLEAYLYRLDQSQTPYRYVTLR